MQPAYKLRNLKLGTSPDTLVSVSELLDVAISATQSEIGAGSFQLHLRDNNLEYRMEYLEAVTRKKHRDGRGRPYGFPGFAEDWCNISFEVLFESPEETKIVSGATVNLHGSAHPVMRHSSHQKIYGLKVLQCQNSDVVSSIHDIERNRTENSLLATESTIGISLLSNLAEEYRNLLRMFGSVHHNMMRFKTIDYFKTQDINRDFNNFLYERYASSLAHEADIISDIAIDCRKFLFDRRESDYSIGNLLKLGEKWRKYITKRGKELAKLEKYLDCLLEGYTLKVCSAITVLEELTTKMREMPEILEVQKYVNKTQAHTDREIWTMPTIQCRQPDMTTLHYIVESVGQTLGAFGEYVLQCDMRPEIMGISEIFAKTLAVWSLHDMGVAYAGGRLRKIESYINGGGRRSAIITIG